MRCDRLRMRSTAQLSLFDPPGVPSAAAMPAVRRAATSPTPALVLHTPESDLAKLESLVHRYEQEAHAPRTRTIYQSDWAAFERWCASRGETASPASVDTLCRYLAYLAGELGRKASTIRRARCSIGLAHDHAGLPRPDRHARVRALERGIARLHGAREEGAEPLLQHHLAEVAATFGSSLRDERDRALILLGFAGAYRASDLVALNIEDLAFSEDGLRIFLQRSKDDQTGKGRYTDIPRGTNTATCPVEAVRAWIARVGRPTGPLFRIVSGARIDHMRISTRCVARAVQRSTQRAKISGHFSAHSLRKGLATSAYAHGATEREIQAHGRWKDRRSLDRYIQVDRMPGRQNVADGLF